MNTKLVQGLFDCFSGCKGVRALRHETGNFKLSAEGPEIKGRHEHWVQLGLVGGFGFPDDLGLDVRYPIGEFPTKPLAD